MEKLKREFIVPYGCSKDIELMALLLQAYKKYKPMLTEVELRAAVHWFKNFIDSNMNKK